MTKKYIAIVSVLGITLSTSLLINPVFAKDSKDNDNNQDGRKNGMFQKREDKKDDYENKERKSVRMAPAVKGVVSAVSGNAITLKDGNGTSWTVDATDARLVRRYGAEMKVADIQVNDNLQVFGTVSGSAVTATKIIDDSLQAKNGNFTGTVTALGASSFTLQTEERGTQTVTTSSTTMFRKNGKPAAFSDLAVNQKVHVNGVWNNTNSNVAASIINIILSMTPVRVSGTVQTVSGNTLTVLGSDTTTYTIDATRSQVLDGSGARANVSLVKANDQVVVTGKRDGTSATFTAMRILDVTQMLPLGQTSKERE